jgi:hypothetical protein
MYQPGVFAVDVARMRPERDAATGVGHHSTHRAVGPTRRLELAELPSTVSQTDHVLGLSAEDTMLLDGPGAS